MLGYGLSDHSGMADFQTNHANLGGSKILANKKGSIPLRTGDECLNDIHTDFIKIDTEGHELSVLRGLSKTIRRCRPVIFIEVEENNKIEVRKITSNIGYNVNVVSKMYDDNENWLLTPI